MRENKKKKKKSSLYKGLFISINGVFEYCGCWCIFCVWRDQKPQKESCLFHCGCRYLIFALACSFTHMLFLIAMGYFGYKAYNAINAEIEFLKKMASKNPSMIGPDSPLELQRMKLGENHACWLLFISSH